MSSKRTRSTSAEAETPVFISAPLEDRESKFIGHFSPTLKPKELQELAEIQSASHKILGWRKESNQQSITKAKRYVTGSDDDGEKYAGKKVEKVLEAMQVVGACVVARWYGGVLLGPIRFSHIESVAKEAVRAWLDDEAQVKMKKRKVEEQDAEQARLSTILAQRDQSISVLRDLAAKKELQAKNLQDRKREDLEDAAAAGTGVPASLSSQNPPVNYTAMPLERLRALEKARDATIAFLLKRIDKAEAKGAVQQPASDEPP